MARARATYVDGYVLVIKKKKLAAYRAMAKDGAKVWMKCGALDYKECIGDDLKPNMGGAPVLTFPKLAKVGKGEVVVFSYITYASRSHRDRVNGRVMVEMEKLAKKYNEASMPFDLKRMAYGGFRVMVSS